MTRAGSSNALFFWLAVMCLVMGGTGIWLGTKYAGPMGQSGGQANAEIDTEYRKLPLDSKAPWLTEFTLTDRSGKAISSRQDLQGKVYVVNFFFSTCPTTCRMQNTKFQEVQMDYGPKGVQFLSISCDPETDTPTKLREYAASFKANAQEWLFLTGDLTYIRRIAGEIYEVPLDKQTHTEHFYVTDKWGNQRGRFHWKKLDEMTQLKMLLTKLLAETEPPKDLPKVRSLGNSPPSESSVPQDKADESEKAAEGTVEKSPEQAPDQPPETTLSPSQP